MTYHLFLTFLTKAAVNEVMLRLLARKYSVRFAGKQSMEYAVTNYLEVITQDGINTVRQSLIDSVNEAHVVILSYTIMRDQPGGGGNDDPMDLLWGCGWVPKSGQTPSAPKTPDPTENPMDRIDKVLKD